MQLTTTKLMTGVCAFALLMGGCVYAHQKSEIDDNISGIKTSRMIYRQSKNAKKNFTKARLKRHIDATEPDLKSLEAEDTSSFKSGISLAYSDTHTSSAYLYNEKQIVSMLGPAISEKVLGIVKPQVSQGSSKAISQSAKMIVCHVAYGTYDDDAGSLPVTITILYKTPSLDPMAGAGNSDTHKKETFVGFTAIKGQIDTHDNSIQVTEAYNKINDNGSPVFKKISKIKVHRTKHTAKKGHIRRKRSHHNKTRKHLVKRARKAGKHAKK